MLKDIKSMTLDEIIKDFESFGLKKYKAEQVFRWISKNIKSFDEMSDLSKDLRLFLSDKYEIIDIKLIKKVTIGKNVFIGARSLIMPGTIIGDYSIIAAGSVVRGIIPEHSVWGGVPAKNICSVEEYANKHYLAKDYRV